MIDTQKTAVLAAIERAKPHAAGPLEVEQACSVLGLSPSRVSVADGNGMRATRSGGELGLHASPMTALHMLAHLATPDVFPPHGAEFCENLILVTESQYPHAAHVLVDALAGKGAHFNAEHRKRAVIKAVVQRAADGTARVEAIFSSPPKRVEGSFRYDRPARCVVIDDEPYDLEDLRYLSRLS